MTLLYIQCPCAIDLYMVRVTIIHVVLSLIIMSADVLPLTYAYTNGCIPHSQSHHNMPINCTFFAYKFSNIHSSH